MKYGTLTNNIFSIEAISVLTQEITFAGPLPQPLLPGHLITVTGKILPHCASYSINLKCGKDKLLERDTAFHFNPRIEENYVVRNSYINGRWGLEETTNSYRLNLKKNVKFKVEIFITSTEFLVSLDSKHFCAYKYRVPVHKINSLEVHGDVEVHSVNTTEAQQYPKEIIVPVIGFLEVDHPQNFFEVPWTGRLQVDLQPGWQLEVKGRVKLLPQGFYINLQDGPQLWPHPNIPLHLNPRFISGNHHVIRNSWLNGAWGHEERAGSKFSPGREFDLIIRMESDEFSVWVNDKMTGLFKSRNKNVHIPINSVHIQGDVIIHNVWVNKNIQNIFIEMERQSFAKKSQTFSKNTLVDNKSVLPTKTRDTPVKKSPEPVKKTPEIKKKTVDDKASETEKRFIDTNKTIATIEEQPVNKKTVSDKMTITDKISPTIMMETNKKPQSATTQVLPTRISPIPQISTESSIHKQADYETSASTFIITRRNTDFTPSRSTLIEEELPVSSTKEYLPVHRKSVIDSGSFIIKSDDLTEDSIASCICSNPDDQKEQEMSDKNIEEKSEDGE